MDSITVLDREFYSSRVSQLRRWGINYEQIDILDSINLKKYIEDANIIYHLAGITDVPTTASDNSKNNQEIRKVGIQGTKNIINLSSDYSKIIFPSTHVVFEGIKKIIKDIDENYQPSPQLEYSSGKYKSEQDHKKKKIT